MLFAELETTVRELIETFETMPASRRQTLDQIAAYVQTKKDHGECARLVFICTHNSRRSHLAQIWAQAAAAFYGVPDVRTFSGGTEVTAFNPRAVAALTRAGFDLRQTTVGSNPIYHVRFQADGKPMSAYSKVYSDAPNPQESFCAVMTCTSADKACPVVFGADLRIALPYEDPKAADDLPQESARYGERVREIGRDMLYVFSTVS